MSGLVALLAGLLGAAVLVLLGRAAGRRAAGSAGDRVRSILEEAESQAALRLRESELQAAETRAGAEAQFEKDTRRKRQDLQAWEERLREQDRNLGRRVQLLGQKQQELDDRDARLRARENAVAETEREAQALQQEFRQRLERLAGVTAVQARRDLVREIEADARQEAADLVRRLEEEAREEAGARARRLVLEALQRTPAAEVLDNVVSVVRLPNDDMKGRIIGREGRNIRAIEMATGVDLIVDETPQVILLSSYDPFRRAIAQSAIERLIEDGRIHPARIEEVVSRSRAEMEQALEGIGESAAFELGITGLPPRLNRLLGRLKYRVVLGYNLLEHSVTVARLSQQMAALLGIPAEPLKRAGLLHEIGHAEEAEGHPLIVAADLLAKSGEDPRVVGAIRGLHGGGDDLPMEAILLRAAEHLVVARPGSRDENLGTFIQRLTHLETVAASFEGVAKAYAIRSGRELRVIVDAGRLGDRDVVGLSREIRARIQKEVEYPGSVKISVIRETRAVDYAT
ncbi:MAG: ribonuclease Y [Candidatus Polarisedimenticolia bacterium]